jgi:hypothetical protein
LVVERAYFLLHSWCNIPNRGRKKAPVPLTLLADNT